MGNYCSSTKKDKDTASEKSEESPSYQLSSKLKKDNKEAPLVDPEPTSDISHHNTSLTIPSNGNVNANKPEPLGDVTKPQLKALQSVQLESGGNSPLALQPPCELPSVAQLLPQNLQSLNGAPSKFRRTQNDKKIVLYILAADATGHQTEKSVLYSLYEHFHDICASRGFEIQISDVHNEIIDENFLDTSCWVDSPLEAKGGHHVAATCLAEILRHSNLTYVIPILFLGSSLGSPLLPLTIECQDFVTVLSTATRDADKELLQKWYLLDNLAQPPCYRLKTVDIAADSDATKDLENLLIILVDIFSKELRDLYLTTVVEQEINNTVLISQELSKRCIWIQTGQLPSKTLENGTPLEIEINRRLNNINLELKNQLPEKNLIRIPPTIQLQNDQIAAIFESLLSASIESIIDEHSSKYQIPNCTFGLQKNVLEEIEAVSQHSKTLGQNCAYFEVMDQIQSYITKPSSEPLVIFGKPGSGKSVLAAKVAQFVHKWLPDSSFILRYTRLTTVSTNITSLLGSVAEQVCYLTKTTPCYGPHEINFYAQTIANCIESTKHQLVIFIDSIDEAQNLNDIEWMPTKLNENIKFIITVTSKATNIDEFSNEDTALIGLKNKINSANFIYLNQFSSEQWKDVLSSGGGDFYATSGTLHLPDAWFSSSDKLPLQAKIFWWLAWLGEINFKDISLANICDKVFVILENKFTSDITKYLIALIVASRNGLMETEILKILKQSNLTEDASKIWIKFCWVMGPMLLHTTFIRLIDKKLNAIAKCRYETNVQNAHKILHDFYKKQENLIQDKKKKYQCYNKKKMIELPYHAFKINLQSYITSQYLTDLSWIFDKLNATSCEHILNDIYLIQYDERINYAHLILLEKFLIHNARPLNYDARQFYSLMPAFVEQEIRANSNLLNDSNIVKEWLEHFKSIPIPYLVTLNGEEGCTIDADSVADKLGYDVLTNLNGKGYFVASLSTTREEICVWDVAKCRKVRTMNGIPQPTLLCPVGEFGAAVLCRREIKVLDLNAGSFKVTLKGVMNQKMPYFGLHDSQHLVCLSRNRMYVNLMNLESGDCVTTFKAGEDRFLNSLLVSGDGRMLVCGDETQKPFPLLVWHLTQRKLLYDLRIPHHDFLTSLSAITYEGSYVAVVAKELNEPTPNFIVVYDLQSGTLFKKWKPSCNTVSLAISQANNCVIAGLEDARILIWDLVTGNCKYTLVGHSAPVTLLKLDPEGKVLLSTDNDGRDMSVRLWELNTGKAIAVHTPSDKVTACEILPNGKYVVLALGRQPNLVTLELKNTPATIAIDEDPESIHYGDKENEGKSFQL